MVGNIENGFLKRKSPRLKNYDYSTPGAYFVTICTKDRKNILSDIIVGEGLCALPINKLTSIGELVEKAIKYLGSNCSGVRIDKYIIMPNHIHLIVSMNGSGGHGNPPLQDVIYRLKSFTTHKYGGVLWQRSFYDHIIRNDVDYSKIWEYIDTNIFKWEQDCFYNNL